MAEIGLDGTQNVGIGLLSIITSICIALFFCSKTTYLEFISAYLPFVHTDDFLDVRINIHGNLELVVNY